MATTEEIKESILLTIKKLLGPTEDYDAFTVDIITHINSAFATYTTMGIGPSSGYQITDENNVWSEFTDDPMIFSLVKPAVYLRVKLAFDPPSSSFIQESYKKQLEELEWRMYIVCDTQRIDGKF